MPESVFCIIPQWGCRDGGITVMVVASFHLSWVHSPKLGKLGNVKDTKGPPKMMGIDTHELSPSLSLQDRPSIERDWPGTQSDSMLPLPASFWGL